MTRRSLQNIRRLLAQALHSLTVVTTTTAGNAAGTSIIATRLANAVSSNRYKHAWVMPVGGAQATAIRRVRVEDALNLTTGELMIAPAFAAQVATSVEVEIHRLLPPDDDDGWTGLRTCINNALRECWVTDRLAVTGVTGQASYSLAAYEEWLDADAVLEFRRPALDTTLNPFPAGQFDAVRDADALTLQIAPTIATGDAATVEVFRPADTFVRVAGVWATSTVGLVNETDECLLNPDLVVTVALAHAYAALASGPDGSRYQDLATQQRRRANGAKLTGLDHSQRKLGTALTTGNYSGDRKENPMGLEWGNW
jgi:hypothetical protein